MSKNTSTSPEEGLEELDLTIDNMETESQEAEVKKILDRLPGVRAGRVVQGGVWVSYHAATITMEKICAALQKAGYQAGVFQNSNPPVTGTSAQ
jgi:copper chaperone CopZ